MFNQTQSISNLVIFEQNTKAIALLFGQKSLIFITFQCSIKINQFQIWSFMSKIPRLQPYFLAKNRSLSSLFNGQSNSINFKFGQFGATYQGYSLTFWPNIAHFHHISMLNQNHSFSNLVIFEENTKAIALLFWPKLAHFHHLSMFNHNQSASNLVIFQQNTKAIALLFRPKIAHFHHFSMFNQNQSISNLVIFEPNYQGYSLTCWPNIAHFHHFSMFNHNQSASNLVIFEHNTKAIALLFGQISLIFITFQCSIKISQFQIWSFLNKIPRLQPYFLAKNRSFSSLFNVQSQSISFKFGHV